MGRLQQLHDEQGQSPWLDNLKRGWITSGELRHWVERGVRGVTSNPTIFAKAIEGAADYDDQFRDLTKQGRSVEDSYWELVKADIEDALAILRPVYDSSDGGDGFVSVEVAPELARDTSGTIGSAHGLWQQIDEPNLFVKIPGTAEGLAAIRQCLSEGININVTLLFGLERYGEVIDAHIEGLEARLAAGGDISNVASVASFFVSRVDTEVDRRLEAIGTDEALALRGKAAVANAQLAYELFLDRTSTERWKTLAKAGAMVQRPLWASTSTKNPAYPDTLYVDTLIGPDTVNTMPDATLRQVDEHGEITRTVDADLDGARKVIDQLTAVGIDMRDVTKTLEEEGVASFSKSFDELITSLETKADALKGG
ncbi:MAG TPA: transaldolase [Acidimicrobiales bacterium]|jgi:transaldolase